MVGEGARAQAPSDTTRATACGWRSASLVGWRDQVRTGALDRKHAYGGLFFDRGAFRRLTPTMDHEYDLDLLTYGFTAADDRRWYGSAHAVRTYMGSIHKSRFATTTRTRHRVGLSEHGDALFSAMQQEDLAAQRFFVELGYEHALAGDHRIGLRQTLAAYKPDLDLTLFYAYDSPPIGELQVEAVFLDVANNLIFDRLGVDPVLEDTVRSYRHRPFLLDVYWRSPLVHRFRAELSAGIQPAIRARVRSQGAAEIDFAWRERLHYLAMLLEYQHPRASGGLQVRHTYSAIDRRSAAASPNSTDYGSMQSSRSATLYLLAPIWKLRASAWLTAELYDDRQEGSGFDEASIPSEMDYFERRLTLQARLYYVPERGIRAGAEYLVDGRRFYRDADLMNSYLKFLPWSPNGRLAVHVGYQFSRRAHVLVGAAYDLGGDPFYGDDRGLVRYDGGFGRAVVMW